MTHVEFRTRVYDWDYLVQEDRVHESLYTDPAIFEAEMRHVFGGTWVYLAHESQIPKDNDYITARARSAPADLDARQCGRDPRPLNRCTHRGTTLCRFEKGNKRTFQCPYHGWNFQNDGKLRGVPWPDGYAENPANDPKFNLAQVPRVESYRGFIFGTLNEALPSLSDHLGLIKRPLDEWIDRNPGGKIIVCEANRIKYKGNWKLAYDNSGDGYHVLYSHRSLLETENRFQDEATEKGMSYYKNSPDEQPMYIQYMGNGHHFKDKRPNLQPRVRAVFGPSNRFIRAWSTLPRSCEVSLAKRPKRFLIWRDRSPSTSMSFPTCHCWATTSRFFSRSRIEETDTIWYGTKIEDVDGTMGPDVLNDINTLRMRTQEGFPNFGEVDDVTNFEQIQRGFAAGKTNGST